MWEVLLTATTSWGAVYTLCAAPAVFMMGSFVVGDCFVAEALDAVSGRRADRKGRVCVLSSYSLLALQLFLYPLQVRDTCSPSSSEECDVYDALFWVSWLGTLGLYTCCLLYTSDAADEEDSVDLGGCRIQKEKKMGEG
eukprot:TRINITY_DN51968_c0_g1_i1.p1 TRINITY_DN51968_c0_g1~~TRINITY_DN51968_c0_g1_i1.p1  ORF type:complete len:139 (-),score=7.02 TRINITY_DN51968_c0_g1_i1:12-428(-)